MGTPKSSREKAADYRRRQREKGLRLVQFWVPDTRTEEFREEARRQCEAVNSAPTADEDATFVESLAEELLQELPDY